jgi:hypothetical protein
VLLLLAGWLVECGCSAGLFLKKKRESEGVGGSTRGFRPTAEQCRGFPVKRCVWFARCLSGLREWFMRDSSQATNPYRDVVSNLLPRLIIILCLKKLCATVSWTMRCTRSTALRTQEAKKTSDLRPQRPEIATPDRRLLHLVHRQPRNEKSSDIRGAITLFHNGSTTNLQADWRRWAFDNDKH